MNLKSFAGMLEEMAGVKRESVGFASREYVKQIEKADEGMQKAIQQEDDDLHFAYAQDKQIAWESIYEELEINPNGVYVVNRDTGEVFEKIYPKDLYDMLQEHDALEGKTARTY